MNCDEAIVMMNLYLDDLLNDQEKESLLNHLEQCENCRRRFESYQIITDEIRSLPAEAPPDLHQKIMQGIASQKKGRVLPWRNRIVGLVACAAMVVLVAAGMWSGNWGPFISREGAAESLPEQQIRAYVMPAEAETATQAETDQRNEESPGAAQTQYPTVAGVMADSLDADTGGGELEHSALELSALHNSRNYGEYVVAVGSGDVSQLFEAEAITRYPLDRQIYIEIDSAQMDDAVTALTGLGYRIVESVSNLPQQDFLADDCLIILLEE